MRTRVHTAWCCDTTVCLCVDMPHFHVLELTLRHAREVVDPGSQTRPILVSPIHSPVHALTYISHVGFSSPLKSCRLGRILRDTSSRMHVLSAQKVFEEKMPMAGF